MERYVLYVGAMVSRTVGEKKAKKRRKGYQLSTNDDWGM